MIDDDGVAATILFFFQILNSQKRISLSKAKRLSLSLSLSHALTRREPPGELVSTHSSTEVGCAFPKSLLFLPCSSSPPATCTVVVFLCFCRGFCSANVFFRPFQIKLIAFTL